MISPHCTKARWRRTRPCLIWNCQANNAPTRRTSCRDFFIYSFSGFLSGSVPYRHKQALGRQTTTTQYIRTGFSAGGRFNNLGGHKEIYLKERGLFNDSAKISVRSFPFEPLCSPAPWGSHDSSLLLFSYLLKLINAHVVVIPLFIPSFIYFYQQRALLS